MTEAQERIISVMVGYMLWLRRNDGADQELTLDVRSTLASDYFEQWINALVYELLFPEKLRSAGLHFFRAAEEARLRPISSLKGKEASELSNLFEELYRSEHSLRQSLFALDSIEEIRILENKA
jgi:hypothetical protein